MEKKFKKWRIEAEEIEEEERKNKEGRKEWKGGEIGRERKRDEIQNS